MEMSEQDRLEQFRKGLADGRDIWDMVDIMPDCIRRPLIQALNHLAESCES